MWRENRVDPDQLASSGATLFSKELVSSLGRIWYNVHLIQLPAQDVFCNDLLIIVMNVPT